MLAALWLFPLLALAEASSVPPVTQGDPAAAAAVDEASIDPAVVAPYEASGPLAESARELKEGQWAGTLKRLSASSKNPRELYLRAHALALSGSSGEAARALEALLPSYSALAPRISCLAAAAYTSAGDLDASLRHLGTCAEDPVKGKLAKVERAKLLVNLDRKDEARQELERLAAGTGNLRNEALVVLGQLHADAGRAEAALEVFRKVYLDDPTHYLAERARGLARATMRQSGAPKASAARIADQVEKLLEANMAKTALAALRDLNVGPIGPRPFTPRRCVPLKREAPADAPEAGEDAEAEAGEAADETAEAAAPPARVNSDVGKETESATPRPAPFAIADARETEPLPAVVLPKCAVPVVKQPADPLRCRAQLLEGVTLRKNRTNTRALSLLREVYERCADPAVRSRAAFFASGAANAVKDPDAPYLAELAALQFKESPWADDALMQAASLARDRADRATERLALRRLVESYPESDQRAEALFRIFWAHRAEGHPERGLGYLDILMKEYDAGPRSDGGDAERGRYWWGRTVGQDAVPADRGRGVEMLASLARERPMTFYGLLSRSFLAATEPAKEPPVLTGAPHKGPLRIGRLATDRGFTMGVELLRLGLTREARDALAAVDYRPLREDGRRGKEGTLAVLEMLRDVGDHRTSHVLARRELLKTSRDATDPFARRVALVAYPLAFRDSIRAHCTSAGFPPNFLQGLMREESALDPKAKSPVGARGLTQLMPATAKAVAKSLGLKRLNVDDLWQPDLNIRIGSVYLSRMLRTFGHPGLAAAAYNAGPGAVARWLKGATRAFDEFVEEIPYAETKGYVKRVLRSYAAYYYLYEKDIARSVKVSLSLKPPPPGTTQSTGLEQ
jgi:soluble lytic murein transglycosylase